MTVIRQAPGHMLLKFVELKKMRKAGNGNTAPKPEDTYQKTTTDYEDEKISANNPAPKDDFNAKEPKVDKTSKEASHEKKTAGGGEPRKTSNKKVNRKSNVQKATYMSLRPDLQYPKPKKQDNVMSMMSNMKIRKLQQPMERARQFKAIR